MMQLGIKLEVASVSVQTRAVFVQSPRVPNPFLHNSAACVRCHTMSVRLKRGVLLTIEDLPDITGHEGRYPTCLAQDPPRPACVALSSPNAIELCQ